MFFLRFLFLGEFLVPLLIWLLALKCVNFLFSPILGLLGSKRVSDLESRVVSPVCLGF